MPLSFLCLRYSFFFFLLILLILPFCLFFKHDEIWEPVFDFTRLTSLAKACDTGI